MDDLYLRNYLAPPSYHWVCCQGRSCRYITKETFKRRSDDSDMRRRGVVPKPTDEQSVGASDNQESYSFQTLSITRRNTNEQGLTCYS